MCVLKEVGCHWGGVHCKYIDTVGAHFDSKRCCELGHKGFGGTIHHCKRIGNVARDRGGEDKAALDLLLNHLLEEVVSDFHTGSAVALEVRQLSVQTGVVKEAGYNVASVVKNDLDIDFLSGLFSFILHECI